MHPYALLPGIRLFRSASMVVFLFGFAVVTLSAFGVDRLLELKAGADQATSAKVLRFLCLAAGVLALVLLLAAGGARRSESSRFSVCSWIARVAARYARGRTGAGLAAAAVTTVASRTLLGRDDHA